MLPQLLIEGTVTGTSPGTVPGTLHGLFVRLWLHWTGVYTGHGFQTVTQHPLLPCDNHGHASVYSTCQVLVLILGIYSYPQDIASHLLSAVCRNQERLMKSMWSWLIIIILLLCHIQEVRQANAAYVLFYQRIKSSASESVNGEIERAKPEVNVEADVAVIESVNIELQQVV